MLRKYSYLGIIGFFLFTFIGCVPPVETNEIGNAEQDFSNPLVQQIYNLQDKQNFDSLRYFIQSDNPMARFCATRAFGSFTTDLAIPYIEERLSDSIFAIKAEAAYVAGQLGNPSLADTLSRVFQEDLAGEVNHILNMHVLEAIGKIGSEQHLQFLATAKPYNKSYDKLNLGVALAVYEFANRQLYHPKATELMVKMVTDQYPHDAALIAANYLNRFTDVDLSNYKFQLLQALKKENDVDIRISLIGAVARIGSPELIVPLMEIMDEEKDYRVIVNAIRKMGNFPYIDIIDKMLDYLSHKNEHVALTAAAYLQSNGLPGDASFYLEYVDKSKFKSVQHAIKGATLHVIDGNYSTARRNIEKELVDEFNTSNNEYDRSDIIKNLGKNLYLIQTTKNLGYADSSLIVRSATVEALGQMLSTGIADKGSITQRSYSNILGEFMNEAILSKDPGMISAAAYAILDTKIENCKNIDIAKMKAAYATLQMPVDLEAIHTLADAINKIDPSQNVPKPKADKIRSFNKKEFVYLGDSLQATIVTEKGNIVLQLYKNHAPSTVQNFIQLSEDQFYNGKYFHRVVPNFVIQAGCPRGDGYGSLDFAIRSELSPKRYLKEGYVGMASAGKHTEGTQWFITHSPTPHLNGRYTIFAKVIKGMDVVHQIERGDKIKAVTILK